MNWCQLLLDIIFLQFNIHPGLTFMLIHEVDGTGELGDSINLSDFPYDFFIGEIKVHIDTDVPLGQVNCVLLGSLLV